jgi:small subunit ribosomal protein S13
MAYLLETNLPNEKKIISSLTEIYGIGINVAKTICKNIGLTENIRLVKLTKEQKNKLVNYIENSNLFLKSDLKRSVIESKTQLINIRSYRGLRQQQGFPVRGQRTHTNSKTSKKLKILSY